MQTILVPQSVEQDAANVWVAVLGSGRRPSGSSLRLLPMGRTIGLPDHAWRPVTAGGKLAANRRRPFVQTLRIPELLPGKTYRVEAGAGSAKFHTLPPRLPQTGEEPLHLLLGSCFFLGNDNQGRAGRLAQLVQRRFPTSFKFLCGDQVYLDILGGFPSFFLPVTEGKLAELFLAKYVRAWTQTPGFQDLLTGSGTYFTADDHEFWNNHPNPATAISYTWTRSGRRKWHAVARSLFEDFQAEDPTSAGRHRSFTVGRLSFFVADTRVFRKPGCEQMMDPADFSALVRWIRDLRGPGVLVIGQPLFATPAGGLAKKLFDRTLPNYRQYHELVAELIKTRWSLLILTGDVHFGRVSECELHTGARLVEVISSPLSLVNALVGGRASDAPEVFPTTPGPAKYRVRTRMKTAETNFATLHVTEHPAAIEVLIRYWFPLRRGPSGELPEQVGPVRLPLSSMEIGRSR